MTDRTSAADVLAVLECCRFTVTTEAEFQQAIYTALLQAGLSVRREVRLNSRDRIDFLVHTVGVEVKVAGSWANVRRQLNRYAESPFIEELVLVTTKRLHKRIGLGGFSIPTRVFVTSSSGL